MWRRDRSAAATGLPEERKALAERYTIDADEALRRERVVAADAVRRAAAEAAARAAAEAATRQAEERERRAAAAELAAALAPSRRLDAREPEDVSPEPEPVLAEEQATERVELPIHRWFENG
jgi:hypothetical protein